jgi:putative radical SAM enzyme (TIGR03279 family)
VQEVEPGSIADELGVLAGDRLLSINGHPLRDLIDYRYHSADADLVLVLEGTAGRRTLTVKKHPDEPLGITFTAPTFDPIRTCANRCAFCFIDALPAGVRPALRLRDDDYRLSFLFGNFITLTNLTAADWERITRWRLSPLYVSVHATNADLRARLLGSGRARRILADLERLGAAGIEVHAQVVVCPGVNDGQELERTLSDLAALWPTVRSVGVVPVGTTAHRTPQLAQVTPGLARELLDMVREAQQRAGELFAEPFAYAADELYFLAGVDLPPVGSYGDFPQLENGIGMAALFLEELAHEAALAPARSRRPLALALITGTLAAGLLEQAAAALNRIQGINARVIAATSEFWGPQVTVAGLLTGADVRAALERCRPGELAVAPEHLLREGRFLDDLTWSELVAGAPVRLALCPPHPAPLFRLAVTGGGGQ